MQRLTFLWEYDIKQNNIAMLRACENDNFYEFYEMRICVRQNIC